MTAELNAKEEKPVLSIPKPAARALPVVALILGFAACADDPSRPGTGDGDDRTPPRTLGLVEVTISGLGTGQVTSSALSAPTVDALERMRAAKTSEPGAIVLQDITLPDHTGGGGDGTIQLELLSAGSFTEGVRGSDGYRYLYATYRVRNAQSDGTAYDTPRRNLTFYAVDTDGTVGETAISTFRRFDNSPADPALATRLIPAGAIAKHPASNTNTAATDVLQAVTEAEAASIAAPAGVSVFPYGFVVRNPNTPTSRTLEANPAADRFDGIVTFAFKVPLQASPADDPFTISLMFLAADDDGVKITQSEEEQTTEGIAAFETRAEWLGAGVVTLLPPAGHAVAYGGETMRVLCNVRVAGPAGSPTATLAPGPDDPWFPISPFRGVLAVNHRITAARCAETPSPGPSNFAVHGFYSGRLNDAYGTGTFMRAPAPPGGTWFPGEEIEVTLTTGLGGTKPIVARYRVAATGGSATFSDFAHANIIVSTANVLGDLDGDGDLDVVAASGNAFHVIDNAGDGRLLVREDHGTPGSVSLALGDLDGDGDLDLVAADSLQNNVRVLLNGGSGNFTHVATYSAGTTPKSVALGDLDGDGDLDLVTANMGSNDVSVLLNENGSFGSHATYGVGDNPVSIVLADLDADGDLDLVTANQGSSNVSVLVNEGGTFGSHTTYAAAGTATSCVVAGDLDGDGDLDLAITNHDSDNMSVLLNQGDGSFGSSGTYATGGWPHGIAIGDLDGDGDPDLVVANQNSNVMSVFLNQGNGSFVSQPTTRPNQLQHAVTLGDMDADGDLDAVVSASAMGVHVLLNQ